MSLEAPSNSEVSKGMGEEISRVADFFRLGLDAIASQNIITIIDRLMEVGFDEKDPTKQLDMERLEQVLAEVLAAQERKNFILVADLLEYQLVPILKNGENSLKIP